MRSSLRVGLAVLAALSALYVTQAASANGSGKSDSELVPLSTETLITSEAGDPGTSEVTGTCNLLGPSTFDFVVTGIAVGPYPGTFRETGSFSLASPISLLTSFEAEFTVTSPEGDVTVRGTKTLAGIAAPGLGVCGEFAFAGQHPDAVDVETPVGYSATIAVGGRSAKDHGESFVSLGETQLRGEAAQGNGFSFTETFASTAFVDDHDHGGGGGGDDDDDHDHDHDHD